jgi:hypothetical protein
MTREEREDAINFFKEVAKREVGTYCKLAIEALEKKTCGDAISREDALMTLTGDITDCTIEEYIARLRDKLSKLPPVTPKEKTGHWIFDEILDRHYYCSECKSMGVDYWDYCPECGARMVESQESEEQT